MRASIVRFPGIKGCWRNTLIPLSGLLPCLELRAERMDARAAVCATACAASSLTELLRVQNPTSIAYKILNCPRPTKKRETFRDPKDTRQDGAHLGHHNANQHRQQHPHVIGHLHHSTTARLRITDPES